MDTLNASNWSVNYSDPNLLIQFIMVFNRIGVGSNLAGTWQFAGFQYKALRGTLTPEEQQKLDSALAAEMSLEGQTNLQITFDGANMTVRSLYDKAQEFIDDWNRNDSAGYNIKVIKMSVSTVQLMGLTTSELVTISWSADEDVAYGSSDTTHKPLIHYNNPTSCPNPSQPDWYQTFLNANRKASLDPKQRLSRNRMRLWGFSRNPCPSGRPYPHHLLYGG